MCFFIFGYSNFHIHLVKLLVSFVSFVNCWNVGYQWWHIFSLIKCRWSYLRIISLSSNEACSAHVIQNVTWWYEFQQLAEIPGLLKSEIFKYLEKKRKEKAKILCMSVLWIYLTKSCSKNTFNKHKTFNTFWVKGHIIGGCTSGSLT